MNDSGRTKSLLLGCIAALVTVSAWGQHKTDWRGKAGWEPEGTYCRLYDTKTVVTVTGTVEKVEKIVPIKGMGYGVHLILKTDAETIPVQLGPVWYVEQQPIQLHPHDAIEVTGSRVPCDGKPVIMAAVIKRGSDTLKFRELKGTPVWSIWQAPPAPKR